MSYLVQTATVTLKHNQPVTCAVSHEFFAPCEILVLRLIKSAFNIWAFHYSQHPMVFSHI